MVKGCLLDDDKSGAIYKSRSICLTKPSYTYYFYLLYIIESVGMSNDKDIDHPERSVRFLWWNHDPVPGRTLMTWGVIIMTPTTYFGCRSYSLDRGM
jgi:hypothetical protein